MKNHLEIEYKTLLTKSEYKRLLPDFSDVNPVFQTNHYIDTPDFDLKNNRLSLRIRTFEEMAELTLKIPQEIGNQEYNQALDIQTARALLTQFQLPTGQIADIISITAIPLNRLAVWGSLTTERYEKETSIGLMALDKNDYLDQTDYELEVEVTDADEGKILFDEFLKKKSIQFKYASSKVARTAAYKKSVQ
ncbi:CYTH domain-containing protein [Streptococcus ruminantium]|uniref:CYTH domain-containing protein n=1 Tax=Streptococcus ruminantium TaxID=1917441 RepID=A0ABU1B3I0_9STRE|nr:CYTH domain-containing protein [Streptococcus ruminantium]MDQ8758790.1 CYTH domain-containing protein [Streptococcus ruminantium]MDQ8768292.1 CYTH domain-containing protein [Streptococcus ruminantium]MDQ8774628.1 CYTH domain-containing protein [Streptococcus ruminantium]MDQ8794807.1 CYTH domain-containing protein [Streptococcus ruminantium]MDQ8795505.1 CYTH domain-containing protein [Streptococcus ruminantium]